RLTNPVLAGFARLATAARSDARTSPYGPPRLRHRCILAPARRGIFTPAWTRGGPEPRSAQEDRSQEADYEPRMTPRPSPQPSISIMDPSIAVTPVSGKVLFGSRIL